jgi:hypothetical protein
MPLKSGKENIGKNLEELKKSDKKRSKKQMLAIVLSTAYGPKKKDK